MSTMTAVPPADIAGMKRLTEFAADAAHLADRRRDLDLRVLIGDLHGDLMRFTADEED